MSEKLEPCPFCGSENVRFDSGKHAVVCMRCKARGCVAPTWEMSLGMWNDRVSDDHAELMNIRIGEVATFPGARADKDQALKVLEEAAEVFGAWQVLDASTYKSIPNLNLLNECADLIQATCNLLATMGVMDFAPYMGACRIRNEERGRFDGRR